MSFTALLNRGAVTPEFNFLHRGVIPAGAGIGHHFHNVVEEMFVILDGEAQFTIDGRTATVKGPAGVLCRAGHSHAIYNPGPGPVQWMNLNVSHPAARPRRAGDVQRDAADDLAGDGPARPHRRRRRFEPAVEKELLNLEVRHRHPPSLACGRALVRRSRKIARTSAALT